VFDPLGWRGHVVSAAFLECGDLSPLLCSGDEEKKANAVMNHRAPKNQGVAEFFEKWMRFDHPGRPQSTSRFSIAAGPRQGREIGPGSERASVPGGDSIPSHGLPSPSRDRKDEILIFLSRLLLKRSLERVRRRANRQFVRVGKDFASSIPFQR